MDNPRTPYNKPRDTTAIYTALAVIALLVVGALVWASMDNEPAQKAAQNQTEQATPPPRVTPPATKPPATTPPAKTE